MTAYRLEFNNQMENNAWSRNFLIVDDDLKVVAFLLLDFSNCATTLAVTRQLILCFFRGSYTIMLGSSTYWKATSPEGPESWITWYADGSRIGSRSIGVYRNTYKTPKNMHCEESSTFIIQFLKQHSLLYPPVYTKRISE